MRAGYKGTVRNSRDEAIRDARMLELKNQGLSVTVIAQRMGITPCAVRLRILRAASAHSSA